MEIKILSKNMPETNWVEYERRIIVSCIRVDNLLLEITEDEAEALKRRLLPKSEQRKLILDMLESEPEQIAVEDEALDSSGEDSDPDVIDIAEVKAVTQQAADQISDAQPYSHDDLRVQQLARLADTLNPVKTVDVATMDVLQQAENERVLSVLA